MISYILFISIRSCFCSFIIFFIYSKTRIRETLVFSPHPRSPLDTLGAIGPDLPWLLLCDREDRIMPQVLYIMYKALYIYIHIYCNYICVCVYIYIYICIYIYVYIYVYIYIYMYHWQSSYDTGSNGQKSGHPHPASTERSRSRCAAASTAT